MAADCRILKGLRPQAAAQRPDVGETQQAHSALARIFKTTINNIVRICPMSLKFRYTILYVDDVPAALSFYEKAFGAQTQMLHEGKDYGELSTGETTLAFSSRTLLQQLGKNPEGPVPDRPTFELAFETDDVDGLFRRACSAGGRPVQEPRRESWGQTTSYVTDPDGFLVEICSPVGASAA